MITEIALLKIREKESCEFEKSFSIAQKIIAGMEGYIEHELQKCIEEEDKYLLIVRWQKLENHTEGFRKSSEYIKWRELLHHYYDPFPTVEHYKKIY
jgi:heme-degrading monooxygenase HmoA